MLCSKYLVRRDGRTAYERLCGRKCHTPVVACGEKVHDKELKASGDERNKFESERAEGVWMGHTRESNEAVIGAMDGFTWSKRMPSRASPRVSGGTARALRP